MLRALLQYQSFWSFQPLVLTVRNNLKQLDSVRGNLDNPPVVAPQIIAYGYTVHTISTPYQGKMSAVAGQGADHVKHLDIEVFQKLLDPVRIRSDATAASLLACHF